MDLLEALGLPYYLEAEMPPHICAAAERSNAFDSEWLQVSTS